MTRASQSVSSAAAPVTIRRCGTHAELRDCVGLQVAVWKFDPIDVVSSHILTVALETGGQVLGAYEGERMVGFAQSFAAMKQGHPYLHSHMVAVLPEHQSRGIGRMLKIAQREEALQRGINLIEWTFDPMEARNANFNIVHLGAIIRRYIPDFYGVSSSPLHANLPTDRLVAEWWLDSPRVEAALAGRRPETGLDVSISVPRHFAEIRRAEPLRAAEIQSRVRMEFLESFDRHRAVTGFLTTETEGQYQLGAP